MRTLTLALALVLGAVGCGSSSPMDDMATGGGDLASSGGDGGLLPLGATGCTSNAQCDSMLCAPYQMGAVMRCTLACTANMAAPQCVAPGNGMCNGMGYCKFN